MALNLHRVDSFFSTRVDLLATAIADADTWTDPKSLPAHQISSIVSNSSLVDVSRSFCLNEKQHKAFVRVGRPFLQSLLSTSPDNVPQCLFFLGGGPGTGKSQVIRALQVLAHSWASENAVKTVAYQGVAAEAANGQTIHKLFQWGVRKGVHNKRYAVADKERFASFKLLIMDEVSTTDAKYIGMIDIALRDLKNEPDKRFGGVHMLFAGDWLQQLPVAGHPAFVREPPPPTSLRSAQIPQNADDATTTYLLRQRGIQAYGEINDVVMLDVNMRHRNDPVWRDILSRWRLGDYQHNVGCQHAPPE
ncbi:putative mitochondrial protein [Phytophthora megakarya]|uniref:ATP-dependent DNA helicase n=1 Tax=Phytophthora megakarya TaxID=4795 RepID=A0A225VZC1_9STRA|nr:putative mitochondrial protein [Phytophthora megakarya]